METDGGGWTVFQRRQDGSVDFNRGWDDYVRGFGQLIGEHWLGLEKIHRLTKRRVTTLRVDVEDFQGNSAFTKYDTFRVLDSSTNYRLSVAGYSGTAGDPLWYHNAQQFTTTDRDNDQLLQSNCAFEYGGAGWWYRACIASNLNGPYNGPCNKMRWGTWRSCTSLKYAEMKLH